MRLNIDFREAQNRDGVIAKKSSIFKDFVLDGPAVVLQNAAGKRDSGRIIRESSNNVDS